MECNPIYYIYTCDDYILLGVLLKIYFLKRIRLRFPDKIVVISVIYVENRLNFLRKDVLLVATNNLGYRRNESRMCLEPYRVHITHVCIYDIKRSYDTVFDYCRKNL